MTQIIRIDLEKPDSKGLEKVVDVLNQDGIIIYPTDSVYTMGCSMKSDIAFKKLCAIKNIKPEKSKFSIVCSDFSDMSRYSKQLTNAEYRLLNNCLPGPYTFILGISKEAVKKYKISRKTMGFRIPNINLIKKLIESLECPIYSASIQLHSDSPYATTSDEILQEYDGIVDLIIDGGICGEIPTTIIDMTDEYPTIVRQGAGKFELI